MSYWALFSDAQRGVLENGAELLRTFLYRYVAKGILCDVYPIENRRSPTHGTDHVLVCSQPLPYPVGGWQKIFATMWCAYLLKPTPPPQFLEIE